MAEQLGHQLHFVQHHQLVAVPREEEFGLGQLRAIGGAFQVEHDGPRVFRCQRTRQSALAHLARAQQHDARKIAQALAQGLQGESFNHPRILCMAYTKCKVKY